MQKGPVIMKTTRAVTALGFFGAFVGSAFAADAPAVTQKTEKGEINWSEKTITVTGSGTFSNSASNAAQARLMATKAAKMDAQRNLLETIKGVNVSSGAPAATVMATSEVRAKVEGLVKNFEVVDTKYFSDGGVDVVVRMQLDGSLAEALLPDAGSKQAKPAAPAANSNTALIVDAKGLKLEPAMAPKIFDESGKELFSSTLVAKDKVRDNGVASYVKSVDAAKADKRAGSKPLVLKASKRADGSKNDIVLSAADAAQLKDAGYLSEGRVVIVVD
jgi:hypothetical protein